jgi:chromosome transmission fidelity protein 4
VLFLSLHLLIYAEQGGDKHPHFPKPIISDIKLSMPLCNLDSGTGILEQRLLLKSIVFGYMAHEASVNGEEDDRFQEFTELQTQMDKISLQLIQQACKAEKSMRALDLCTTLHLDKSMEIAYRLASQNHLNQLAERINLVKQVGRCALNGLDIRDLNRQQAKFSSTPYAGAGDNAGTSGGKRRFGPQSRLVDKTCTESGSAC